MKNSSYILALSGSALLASAQDDSTKPAANINITVPGYDLSKDWPSESQQWHLNIDLYRDFNVSRTADPILYGTWARGHFFPDTSAVPELSDEDRDAGYCLSYIPWSGAIVKDGDEVNGNCEGVIEEKCLDALRSVAEDKSWCNSSYELPEACASASLSGSATTGGGVERAQNATSSDSEIFAESVGDPYEEKGDTTAWDEARDQVWVVLVGWGKYEISEGESIWNSFSRNDTKPGSLSCLRPTEVEDASETDNSESGSAALSMPSFLFASILAAIVTVGGL